MAIEYEFAGIEGSAGDILSAVGTTNALLEEGKGSLASLAMVWGGEGSTAYQAVQNRWDSTAQELNEALKSLAHAISNAGEHMLHTEQGVTGMFT
ncbi:WXG100 family type VII secretion target [Mycolicibacterium farcinogenes]|nr:WXG100 family type VII secretion target [Mycolicibacterium farcinogenes]